MRTNAKISGMKKRRVVVIVTHSGYGKEMEKKDQNSVIPYKWYNLNLGNFIYSFPTFWGRMRPNLSPKAVGPDSECVPSVEIYTLKVAFLVECQCRILYILSQRVMLGISSLRGEDNGNLETNISAWSSPRIGVVVFWAEGLRMELGVSAGRLARFRVLMAITWRSWGWVELGYLYLNRY